MNKEIIPLATKKIVISYTNSNSGNVCFRVTFPYQPVWGKKVNVSNFYKKFKPFIASAEGVPVDRIKGKHTIISQNAFSLRILYEWPGGISLDMPYDADSYDYSIVLKQLEVLQMKFNRP